METQYPRLGETVFRQILPNGLQVTVVRRPGFQKKAAYFVTDFGSIHTRVSLDGKMTDTPPGIAHYLEHKLFDMPGGGDVSSDFAALGATVNAFTDYDMTAYYFSCTENFRESLKLLLEFVSTPCFTAETVEKERGIINQEIAMNLDEPESVIYDDLMAAMYHTHPARVPILGTRESIREITPELLAACHKAFYTPGNMELCVVGDVAPETVIALAREILGDEPRTPAPRQTRWNEPETPVVHETHREMDVAMPQFLLGFKCPDPGTGESAIRTEFLADLAAEALFGESSELYLSLYEQGLIDGSFGGGYETISGCAMLQCSGDSDDPDAIRRAVLEAARRLGETGVSRADFLRLKRSAFGRRIRGLDSFDGTCFRVCAYRLSEFDYFRFPELYDSISENDLVPFLETVVRPETCVLSIIYPKEELS